MVALLFNFTRKDIMLAAAFALVYFISAKLGLKLAFVHPSATAIWPPTGLSLAALLIFGYRIWPGVLAGAFAANLLTAGSILTSLGIAAGNILEAVAGAWLVQRFAAGRRAFDKAMDIFRFVFLAAFLSTALSATIGVLSLCLGGYASWGDYPSIWFSWWLGNAISNIVVAPMIVIWHTYKIDWNRSMAWEGVAFAGVFFLLGLDQFSSIKIFNHNNYALSFLFIPLLLWASFRFGLHGVTATTMTLSAIALLGTLHGVGPFYVGSPNESLLILQVFMGVVAIPHLLVASMIKENRCVRQALEQRSEEDYRRLFESNPVPMWFFDKESRSFLDVNKATVVQYGYKFEEFSQLKMDDLLAQNGHPPSPSGLYAKNLQGEWTHRRKDGTLVEVHLNAYPTMFKGRPACFVQATDITKSKWTRDRLAAQTKELERSNKDLEQFAYIASHDLQEPLRKMRNFSEAVLNRYRGRLDHDADRYLGHIMDGASRLQKLIEDLLCYARTAYDSIKTEPTSMEEVLSQVLDTLENSIVQAGVIVTHEPLPIVAASPVLMYQVLQNLLANAIKFRSKKPPQIHLSCRMNGKEWTFCLSDNGIGIDHAQQERIFLLFQRLHTRQEYPGTGLGLAMCKKIIERCGGRIWVESEPGEGSRFCFTLPK